MASFSGGRMGDEGASSSHGTALRLTTIPSSRCRPRCRPAQRGGAGGGVSRRQSARALVRHVRTGNCWRRDRQVQALARPPPMRPARGIRHGLHIGLCSALGGSERGALTLSFARKLTLAARGVPLVFAARCHLSMVGQRRRQRSLQHFVAQPRRTAAAGDLRAKDSSHIHLGWSKQHPVVDDSAQEGPAECRHGSKYSTSPVSLGHL